MKDKNRIFNFFLSCVVMVVIFGYTIMAEEEEGEKNQNTSIKFNQIPNIEIRPINDKINKTTDGSVELFAGNPSTNQFTLQVDFLAILPSGINLYSDELPLDEKPEAVIGSFQVMPGQKKEIYIRVKSNNKGNYSVQYNVIYYPVGNRRDNVKDFIMNYFVEEPSISNKPNMLVTPEVNIKSMETRSDPRTSVTSEIMAIRNNPNTQITPEIIYKTTIGNKTKTSPFISIGIIFVILIIVFCIERRRL